MDENKEKIKVADAWYESIRIACPYCGEHQDTFYDPGETDTCDYCDKEFEIGEVE